jgi:phosphatidylserine decarboxylase
MNKNAIKINIFRFLPQRTLSRVFGYLARININDERLQKLINWYSKKFGVVNEYIIPPEGFKTFDEFFTRRLMPGARFIEKKASAVSPVDARIDQQGKIDGETLVQAKGLLYSLNELIPSSSAKFFAGGEFMTLYLSPGDYHRIHSPVNGRIWGWHLVPGRLFTVQEYMVMGLPGLFARNERLITHIITDRGRVAVCKIGAFNVGCMSLSYDEIESNSPFEKNREKHYAKGSEIEVSKGDEIGAFHLGSTIVLVFSKGMAELDRFEPGTKIKMGQRIAGPE